MRMVHDPRMVGETWRSDYWGMEYTVVAKTPDRITVRWADGSVTTHCTAIGKDVRVVASEVWGAEGNFEPDMPKVYDDSRIDSEV